MSSLADYLKGVPYFSALSPEEREKIAKDTLERSFDRGEVIFLEGEPCQGLYLVKSGRVRIFKSSPEGREQVLMTAAAGTTFNEVPVFDGGPNPASASALEQTTIYVVPTKTVNALLAGCPAAQAIIKLFAGRLRHLSSVVEDLSFRSVVSRLARLLLDSAVVQGGPSPVPRLTQEEMATMIGSVRDVVGRGLRALEKAGAIRIEGQRILVVDPEKLKEAR
ncbi:MAG: Crp/Fnr family transcriptional regulator [Chloroflexi bacterium]|nr:Crp/Fnr family transcriptional regulator [Chloroflexota bacterium]